MNGGYILVDLSRYGNMDLDVEYTLTDREYQAIKSSYELGKPLMIKLEVDGHRFCGSPQGSYDGNYAYLSFTNYDGSNHLMVVNPTKKFEITEQE